MAWNKPSTENQQQKKPSAKAPSAMKGIIAGTITITVGAVCIWMFSGEEDASTEVVKNRECIKDVGHVVTPTNAVIAKPVDPSEDYDHTQMYRDERGILRWNSGCRAPDPLLKKKKPSKATNQRRIFKHTVERHIASLLMAQPGDKRYFTPDYNHPKLLKDFEESLKDAIVINPDDSNFDKCLKQGVIDAKKEIAERIAKGEKLGDILTETSKELQRMGEYSEQLKAEVKKVLKDKNGEMSERDVGELVEAANQMLKENGCNPISASQIVISNIRLQSKARGLSAEERRAAVSEYREKVRAEARRSKDPAGKGNNKEKEGRK